jgi:hypothetical protein
MDAHNRISSEVTGTEGFLSRFKHRCLVALAKGESSVLVSSRSLGLSEQGENWPKSGGNAAV